MSEHIQIEQAGGRLRIRMNRPERRNAITVAMYAALADAIERAATDPDIRLITIEGVGEDFTAGNDLADFLAEMPPPGTTDIPVWRLLRALAKNEVPIVAAVHGNAVGIGTTMLFHCDLVIAEQGTRFVMPFVDLGLVPEAASSLILTPSARLLRPVIRWDRHATRTQSVEQTCVAALSSWLFSSPITSGISR